MAGKSRRKGYRTVAAGRKIFLEQGYIGANLEKSGRFVNDKDLFGLWDYLFVKGKEHIFVQFKTNLELGKKRPRKWLRPYIEFGKKHGSKYVKYQIYVKYDRKPFKVVYCA